jgi:formyl-CoA transferase
MQGVYPRFSRTPGAIRQGAPKLGQHNDDVYRDLLGLTQVELERLRAQRVI